MSRSGNGVDTRANGRLALPLVELPSQHPCHSCGACCRYVAVEIDAPTTPRDYDQIHWYLTHREVAVYLDWEGDWYLEFQTVCEHLSASATCGIYRERPEICAEFSWDDCEETTREPGFKYRWVGPDEFFTWLRKQRPRAFERYTAHRRRMIAKREGRRTPSRRRSEAQSSTSI